MKIECPSCHLSGKVNELELPPEGRELKCPRCKGAFHVKKPSSPAGQQELMSMCPVCQYSTFTDETFAVCPKCGLVGSEYRKKMRIQKDQEKVRKDQEKTRKDEDLMTRSHRNPDLVTGMPDDAMPEIAKAPQPILVTGWSCVAIGGVLLLYGLNGLLTYYSKDWQAVLAEQMLEPLSETSVFFRMGFIPWLITLFSGYLIATAAFFLQLSTGSLQRLKECAWAGLGVGVIHEAVDFFKWVEISSSTPSVNYLVSGVLSSLLWIVLWSAPSITLLWFLGTDKIRGEFPDS